MKTQFLQGDIVKSISRSSNYPLFLMVLADLKPSIHTFRAVVIKDVSGDFKAGEILDNWKKPIFDDSTLNEILL